MPLHCKYIVRIKRGYGNRDQTGVPWTGPKCICLIHILYASGQATTGPLSVVLMSSLTAPSQQFEIQSLQSVDGNYSFSNPHVLFVTKLCGILPGTLSGLMNFPASFGTRASRVTSPCVRNSWLLNAQIAHYSHVRRRRSRMW